MKKEDIQRVNNLNHELTICGQLQQQINLVNSANKTHREEIVFPGILFTYLTTHQYALSTILIKEIEEILSKSLIEINNKIEDRVSEIDKLIEEI
jgi:hypothetical protein